MQDLDSGQVYVDAADLRDYLGKLDPDTHSETLQNFKDEIADFRRAIIDRFDIIGFASLLYKDLAGRQQAHHAISINRCCHCELHTS